jgi:hypothetical protein
MPNTLDATGLTLKTQEELIQYFTEKYQAIYGADINLDQDSPDGQWMMIQIQAVLDIQDLIMQVYNSMDPDLAIGNVLDQRVAINGIQRQAGTYTLTNVSIVTTAACNLYGLDQELEPVYTVQDNAGNQFYLVASSYIAGAGTTALSFRAKNPGAVLTVPNTITTPVTIVLGVDSVNNPTSYSSLGINEETDNELRIRRQKSVALASQGYLAGLIAALENLTGMNSVYVYENTTSVIDGDLIPGHSIWVVVSGTADSSAIANAIYQKRNAGCGMKGSETYNITQPDGTIMTIRWDMVAAEDLYIKFEVSSLDGTNDPDYAGILSGLPASLIPGVYQQVNINELATLVQDIDANTLVTNAGFSTSAGGTYYNSLTPTTKADQFAVSAARIILLPILLTPKAPSVVHAQTEQFSAIGGYGSLTYSLFVNNSGGSINSSSGLYTAGATPSVSDTVRVTDSLGNYTDVIVAVI